MNQYSLLKYAFIVLMILLGVIYALPNLYGEYPALQISPTRAAPVDQALEDKVRKVLTEANMVPASIDRDEHQVLARFDSTDVQLKANDTVAAALGGEYVVALNLAPATPAWLRALGAKPMYLGLDLRGGVHFLMEVDMKAVVRQAEERFVADIRSLLRDKKVRYKAVTRREGAGIDVSFGDATTLAEGEKVLKETDGFRELQIAHPEGGEPRLVLTFKETFIRETRQSALEQNLTTLRNRINELGVAEPIIQRQGEDRIVVQLPGVQDTAHAKEILGATATLEFRMVDEEHDVKAVAEGKSTPPPASKLYKDRKGTPYLLKKQLMLTGESIINARSSIDPTNGGPVVSIELDSKGGRIFNNATKDNVGKLMSVVFLENKTETQKQGDQMVKVKKSIEEIINVATIRERLGKSFQISGLDSTQEARNLALFLRAGALAAPIQIIEERTVGPSLGVENIQRGIHSTWAGFAAIAVFMIAYYLVFGVTAVAALAINVVLLVAVLSMIQSTLTLPGMAGIALTIGMAIDANVLINERIREELRNGNSPQASINAGYERALGTILDTNITTLIAGLALFLFGSGPIRGFAVVLCLGILTSIFSAVMVSRGLVNLYYGRKRKLSSIAIGNTSWK
jgi:preprotein translocase subunit SecD